MYKLILFLGICSAFASGSKPPEKLPAKPPARQSVTNEKCQKIVGCYYENDENEMSGEALTIEMIDASLCTHLIYSMAVLGKNGSVDLTDDYMDIDMNGFQRINNLKKKNIHLKTLITIEESITADDKNNDNKILFNTILREKLANNIVNLVQKYKFNGIVLEPQYLNQEKAVASDKQNFVLLLKVLKKKFDEHSLILSLAFDARESTAEKYDIKEISKYVSFINLKTYNLHEDYYYDAKKRGKAAHIAPLYRSPKENKEERKLNVDYIVNYWLSQHVPPNKLILGTTARGLIYDLASPKKFGKDAPVVKDPAIVGGEDTAVPTIRYYNICPWERNRVWTTFWDKEQQVPYIHKEKEMYAYDNVASIKLKAEYAKKMKLGGVFIDKIDDDDFDGHCEGGKFTLLRSLSRVIRDKC